MLFKMFSIEQSSAAQKRRQVFITQSRVLTLRVQEYYIKLAQSLATGRKNPEEPTNITQDTLVEKKLMDHDEERHSQSRLPKKFCELTDDHFPLFITFDKVIMNSIRYYNAQIVLLAALSSTGSRPRSVVQS